MTRREQILLLGVAAAVLVGGTTLYLHDRAAGREPAIHSEPKAVVPDPVRTIPIEQPRPPVAAPTPPAPLAVLPPNPKPEPPIAVSIGGAVHAPGLYRFEGDARVKDLIDAGNGVTPDADLSDINQAARLMDGSTLTIPAHGTMAREGSKLVARGGQAATLLNPAQYTISGSRGPQETPAPANAQEIPEAAPISPADHAARDTGPLDLNTASAKELESLPGIGSKLAEAIVKYRAYQPFTAVDDLINVTGIGPKRLERIRGLVIVRPLNGPPPGASPAAPK